MNFKIWINESDDPVKVKIPAIKQTTKYSCGAACVNSIYKYFKVKDKSEDYFIERLDANQKLGTSIANIIKIFKEDGFFIEYKDHMYLKDLENFLNSGIPVICPVQAWGSEKYYKTDESGHYLVAIGNNEQRIYFMDPTLDKSLGYMTKKDFLERWHDKDDKRDYTKFGIAVWYGKQPKESNIKKLMKIK